MATLKNKTVFISGGSRGIGLAIALRAAADGANLVVAAKTVEQRLRMPGTIYSAAKEIEAAGGSALPLVCDIRDENQVDAAVDAAVERFGGIDIVVNNALAVQMTTTDATEMKRFDLMHQINARGTYVVTKKCLPHLKKSSNAHILTMSPPLDFAADWVGGYLAYSMSKYAMSLSTLGWAKEFARLKIAANSLWPLTAINTPGSRQLMGGDDLIRMSRKPEIMADAAHAILTSNSSSCSGNFFVDELVLRNQGVTDFDHYANDPDFPMMANFFLSDEIFDQVPTRLLKTPDDQKQFLTRMKRSFTDKKQQLTSI